MSIDNEIIKKLNITRYSIERNFFSKCNSVYLIRDTSKGNGLEFIYKEYKVGDIEKECAYLSLLKELNVPKVYARGKDSLCLEYIKGKTLLECLEEDEEKGEPFSRYIDALVGFLKAFYIAMPGHIYGDINLRNFIATENGIYGVDLEEAWMGNIETDIGRLAAFILTYNPEGTDYKKSTAAYLVKASALAFGLSRTLIEQEKEKELASKRARRNSTPEKGVHISCKY